MPYKLKVSGMELRQPSVTAGGTPSLPVAFANRAIEIATMALR